MKEYKKPGMEFWDLEEEEDVITGSLNGKPEEDGSGTGDFNGDDVNW